MAETWGLRDLLEAGWSEADLEWEGLAEMCAERFAAEDPQAAGDAAGRALVLARDAFKPDDPRLAASLVNHACSLSAGNRPNADKLMDEARAVWRRAGPWIAAMTAPRSARSSLFHLRMEMRHRETFEENWRVKWCAMAEDAVARLDGAPFLLNAAEAGHRLETWRRERPAMLNDTRKLMAAVRLSLV